MTDFTSLPVAQRASRRPRKRGLFVLADTALRSACSGLESVMERRDPETSPVLPLASSLFTFRDGLLFAVAPIGDTEMLTRALGPRRRLGDSSACLSPPPDRDTTELRGAHEPATTHRSDRIHWMD